ncbi:MAG TPA: polyprenyl synthetase family protein [Anaerolineae bacterium]|nr:polyprenyl synthetase family protein [Anaerolineae bacterium]
MTLQELIAAHIPMVEAEMHRALSSDVPELRRFYGMMGYHLGWLDEALQPCERAGGKRVRPLLCLLACEAAGGDSQRALPAAAAIELLHNFSLIHDDIEDDSPTRRHRAAVWALWGVPQAINAGDGLFVLAYRTLHRLVEEGISPALVLRVARLFDDTCLALTEGQFLDMSFESRLDVSVDDYLRMIRRKTAALMGAAAATGALLAGANEARVEVYHRFGTALGMAFQIQDDILGIWGEEVLMGKSAESDILQRKKSLPVVYALQGVVGERLRALYSRPRLTAEDVPTVLALLAEAKAREYAEAQARRYHEEALAALDATGAPGTGRKQLLALVETLSHRQA